jgi:tape measure domain-containing protein
MANRISLLVALEGADEGLKRAISSAERSFNEMSATAKTAGANAAQGMAELKAGTAALGDQLTRARTQLLAFVGVSWATQQVTQLVQVADQWNLMVARLKLATAGQREFVIAHGELFAIAQRIGVPLAEVSTLYGKLQQAVRQLGGEQKTALSLTESISQALRISGASASEAQSSLLQFGQALASGVLRGEEFNSVVENSPRLAQALADGLNVPIGRLRKLAEQGQLTADVVVNALMSQKDKLAAEYAQLPVTVGTAFERLKNAFAQWIAKVDESSGITRKLATALDWLARNFETVMGWLKLIAEIGLAVLIYRLIPALITAWQLAGTAAVTAAASTSAAWATANLSMSAAVATAGLLKTSFAVLAAALIGWEIGTWLSEKFEVVRKAGIGMVQVLETGLETLKFSWERFAAIFTSDTIAAATQRHEDRLRQMNAIFGEMYVDASEAGRAAQQAATTAAASAEEMARRLEAVRQGTQEAVGRGIEAIDATLNKLKSQITAIEQVVTAAQQGATQAISGITQAYQGLTGIVDATLQQQLASTQAHYAQKQVLLEQSSASEAQLIKQTTQLLVESVQQQSDLRAQALTDTLRLIEQEGQARRVAAQRQAETDEARRAATLRIDNEILAAKQQALAQAAADYVRHVDALNAEANRHLAEIRRIEDEKRALSQTTEDRIRELQRSTMGEYQAYQDKLTQVAELQRKARAAISEGEFELAIQYAKQAQDLAAQTAKAVKDGDATIVTQKQAVKTAIDAMRESEQLAIQALEGEGRAHQKAASEATSARGQIETALRGTQAQIEQIQAQLETGLKFAIDVDSSKLDAALRQLEEALREKAYLVRIDADLKAAHAQLRDLEAQLKDGKTLLVNADISRAKSALETLQTYADRTGQIDLKVATEKAQTSLRLIESQIRALDEIRTESQHAISTNANQARSEIRSLDGMNTSSTHTIYVKRVEQNASGGLVGSGMTAPRGYAKGGSVLSFSRMKSGVVPGSGDGDTVPRALEAGAFVIRKAAVRKYGAATLRKLAGVARFATGGSVPSSSPGTWSSSPAGASPIGSPGVTPPKPKPVPTTQKVNRDVSEALKLIELGLQGARIGRAYMERVTRMIPIGSQNLRTDPIDIQALQDREYLQRLLKVRKLTSLESGSVDTIKGRWRTAMAQGQLAGVDLERQLIEYIERETERQMYFARGGLAKSDTVPAMLTPGEYVVSRESVKRLGAGFFAAINAMKAPAKAVATTIQGFARGGLVSPNASTRVATVLRTMPTDFEDLAASGLRPRRSPRLDWNDAPPPSKTIRVELASGARSVSATIPARDESRLLDLLREAQARA